MTKRPSAATVMGAARRRRARPFTPPREYPGASPNPPAIRCSGAAKGRRGARTCEGSGRAHATPIAILRNLAEEPPRGVLLSHPREDIRRNSRARAALTGRLRKTRPSGKSSRATASATSSRPIWSSMDPKLKARSPSMTAIESPSSITRPNAKRATKVITITRASARSRMCPRRGLGRAAMNPTCRPRGRLTIGPRIRILLPCRAIACCERG
jgi:hypothetical protein